MRLTSALLAVAAFIGMMTASSAQAATAQGTANATVAAAISIEAGAAMNFGKVVPPSTGSGTASSAGGVTGGVTQYAPFNNQTFTVTGDSSLTYNTTGSDASVTLSDGGANSLTASLVYTSANTFQLLGGNDTLTATGDLTVPSTAVPGSYTGTYNVVVNYN